MPTISLRLSEEELEQLRAWAHDGHRSLQKEIVWRLFTSSEGAGESARDVTASREASSDDLGEVPVARAAVSAAASPKISEVSGGQRLPSPAQTSAPSEAKPDFKKGKK